MVAGTLTPTGVGWIIFPDITIKFGGDWIIFKVQREGRTSSPPQMKLRRRAGLWGTREMLRMATKPQWQILLLISKLKNRTRIYLFCAVLLNAFGVQCVPEF